MSRIWIHSIGVLVVSTLGACRGNAHWVHPDVKPAETQTAYRRTRIECEQEHHVWLIEKDGTSRSAVNEEAVTQCLKDRGWRISLGK